MYNLTNSPSGPIGQAGMSNNSTQPKSLFANAPASFNNFGKGIESAANGRFGGIFSKFLGNVFGKEGGLDSLPQMNGGLPGMGGQPNQAAGAQSIFGEVQGSQNQTPQVQPNVTASASQPSGGFLSKFMQ